MRTIVLQPRAAGILGILFFTAAACGDEGGADGSSGAGGGGGDGGAGPAGTSSSQPTTTGDPSSPASTSVATTVVQASASSSNGSGGAGGTGDEACLDESVFDDPSCDACVQDECCGPLQACLADTEACLDDEGGLDIGTSLGSAVVNCMAAECGSECGYGGICGSNIGYGGEALDECMSEACCDEFEDCTDGGTDISACLLCFNGAGGELCDPAITCANDSGCFCGNDEFTCADGSGCLPFALTCNGSSECADGSDEDDCASCDDVATQCSDLVYTQCTCAFEDPCGWAGDGACDDACADFNPNPFDDSVDCGGPCNDVAAECAAEQYTECTCDASDPCGWIGDGYCDIACDQVSDNPFDDTSDCDSGGLVISCTDPNDPLWLPECNCISNGGSGEPTYEGVSCDGGFGSGSFCCAEPGFPGAGNGCSCYDQQGANWQCNSFVAEFCSCGFDSGPPGGGPCDNVPLPNGIPWLCCASASTNDCACFQNDVGQACAADEVVVSSCTNVPAGWLPPRQSCPGGTTPVLECSPGADCESESDCPGDCWGSDPLYCPSCNAGSCEVCAISSSGSVTCF